MRVAKSIPGWHLPSAQEWNEAALACGAKVIGDSYSNSHVFTDYGDVQELKTKLNVELVGFNLRGSMSSLGREASFQTSTKISSTKVDSRVFDGDKLYSLDYTIKPYALSVRLIKD